MSMTVLDFLGNRKATKFEHQLDLCDFAQQVFLKFVKNRHLMYLIFEKNVV